MKKLKNGFQTENHVQMHALPCSNTNGISASQYAVYENREEFTLNENGFVVSASCHGMVTGYFENEVLHKHISLFYMQEDANEDRASADLKKAEQADRYVYNGWKLRKKGTSFLAKVKIKALRDPNDHSGKVKGYRFTLTDLSYAISTHPMNQTRGEYSNMFQNSTFGILKFNIDTLAVTEVTDKALEILGRVVKKPFFIREIFSAPGDCDSFIESIQHQQQVRNFEFKLNFPGRENRWVCLDCTVFRDKHQAEVLLFDVSSYKNQINRYNRLKEDMDSFIYHTSHDLRSPLSTILGLINLIKLDKPSEVVSRYTDMIEERIRHLDELLKDLSAIAYNNNSEPMYLEIDVRNYVEHTIKDLLQYFPKIEILIDIDANCAFYSDNIRFSTILRNIISNSFKFSDPLAKNPYIKIDITISEASAKIKVSDNGIGIDNRYLFQIFNMFSRASAQSSGGNGLGLYIVKSMVDKLEGTVEVRSALGKGSEFHVELPNRLKS